LLEAWLQDLSEMRHGGNTRRIQPMAGPS